ncbi:matrix metalloproteinase-14 (membrane-inserted) [Mytilus galloprovincialis]|uniref:Matrix metalloproteinase-14 (Membrane-inserted) n=1 Tax=Mytilus galloprovincialis TaxID=29158 RepID=A0A8B6GNX4_MYTGA|nr:matrix metalloproteinase-14 (membrane-inserted) [Mytilus galloprovincialis]
MDIVNRLILSLTLVLQFIKYETLGNLVINADETNYLMKYGYIPPELSGSAAYRTEEFYKDAVKNFQMMANLPVTGVLDTSTKEMMKRPRCGVKDDMQGTSDNAKRKKRYALHGSKWSKHYLTYKISKYGTKLKKADVDREIHNAFNVWSEVSPLTFTRKYSGSVDIDIRFEKYWHGDNNPFDGQGQTLAHAFFPQFGGDAHFDDDEPWTINLPDGVDFFQVATHEFGHSLGLAHSNIYSALMAPFYKGHTKDFKLGRDDVAAIQALYGTPKNTPKPTIPTTTTTTTTTMKPWKPLKPWKPMKDQNMIPKPWTPKPTTVDRITTTSKSQVVQIPHICRHAYIDAITRLKNGETYIFKGYMKQSEDILICVNRVDSTYPRSVATWWLGCPNQGEMTDIRNPYTQDDQGQSEKNDQDEQWLIVEDDGTTYMDAQNQNNSAAKFSTSLTFIISFLIVLCNIHL